jgi:hypothetical protein
VSYSCDSLAALHLILRTILSFSRLNFVLSPCHAERSRPVQRDVHVAEILLTDCRATQFVNATPSVASTAPMTSKRKSRSKRPIWVKELGFTTLYDPADERTATDADVVFVHGLQGHPWRTWRYKGDVERRVSLPKSKGPTSRSIFNKSGSEAWERRTEFGRVFWPVDFLPRDHRHVRILTYGYDSKVTKWFGGATNQMNLEEHANSFLNSLEAERRICRGRPLIFVVHSLGGLVVKQAVCQSRTEEHHTHTRDVFDSLHAIVFFGTPHHGSKDSSWGLLLRDIANAALFDTNDSILRDLDPNTGAAKLELLSSSFAQVLKEKDIRITTFQESRGKAGIKVLRGKVRFDNQKFCFPFNESLGRPERFLSIGNGGIRGERFYQWKPHGHVSFRQFRRRWLYQVQECVVLPPSAHAKKA